MPVSVLVPDDAQRWRPLVEDAIQFVFSRLSGARLAAKLVEQFELAARHFARKPPDPPDLAHAGPAKDRTGAGAQSPPQPCAPDARCPSWKTACRTFARAEVRGDHRSASSARRLAGIRGADRPRTALRSQRQRGHPLHLEKSRPGAAARRLQSPETLRSGVLCRGYGAPAGPRRFPRVPGKGLWLCDPRRGRDADRGAHPAGA